jgi:hypothetical protein
MTTPETLIEEELTELITRLRTCQERYAEMATVAEVNGWESIRLAAGAMSAELAVYLEERFKTPEQAELPRCSKCGAALTGEAGDCQICHLTTEELE